MPKRDKDNETLFLGYYAVAFIDLLGQQEFLRNLRSLPNPENPQDIEVAKENLKNTYGAVTGMRNFFSRSFEAYARKPKELMEFTPQQKNEFNALTNNPITFQTFSDSIVIYMSLKTDSAKLPARGIFGILGAAAATFTCCLALGHPIRGGIDVGLGMNIAKNEIYGPALSRAYAIESRIANYPRIVVGNELIRYLETTRDQEPKDGAAIVAKKIAESCIACLAVDDDGYPFVDYLGEYYCRMFGEVIDVSVIQKAYNHVLNFTEKYQKEKNSKLAFRYKLLRNYFEDRLPLWVDLFPPEQEDKNKTST
jgi:hypothetical protein